MPPIIMAFFVGPYGCKQRSKELDWGETQVRTLRAVRPLGRHLFVAVRVLPST
jgi:hypothetical protein